MRLENKQYLEKLAQYGQIVGTINIFLGAIIVFIDLIKADFYHIQAGFYIFVTGYAFVKVSQKIEIILIDEKRIEQLEAMDAKPPAES